MNESMGAIVDFRDVLSISDPIVRNVLESDIIGELEAVPHRQFRLTPRVMVLLVDKAGSQMVTEVLRHTQRELDGAHCGHLDWRVYDLDTDGDLFKSECRRTIDASRLTGHDDIAMRADSDRLGALLHIIDALRTIDLASHMRQQAAFQVTGDGARREVFEERWVSLEDLERTLGVPIRNDDWRFKRITEFLDFKVLDHVTHDWMGEKPISVNFCAANVLTPQFDELVFRVNPVSRANLIFELPISDFLADSRNAHAATAKLREGGFQIAIDGVQLANLAKGFERVPEARFLKLTWSDALIELGGEMRDRIKTQLMASAPGRFVLTRCEDEKEILVGQSLGIAIFQGWGVEHAPQHLRSKYAL